MAKKPLKVVMLEHIGEDNSWEWYDVIRDTTPEEAVKSYLEERLGEGEEMENLKLEDDMVYGELTDVRAYYITI